LPILVPNRNVWCIAHAHRFAVLLDAAAFFGAVRQAAIKARRSIAIMGWDLDSRTRLVGETGEAHDGYPLELAPFLGALVQERPQLHVYLLLWDYSVLYAAERESFPLLSLQWKTPPRVQFSLDDDVPAGSSQHQKLVVIDDCLAFSGGLDLTSRRWDTSKHELHNPGRVDHGGRPYRPFHDVQAMADGDAARALAGIVKQRWWRATAEPLPPAEVFDDLWPAEVLPDFTDVNVGIARTQPVMAGSREIREVEQLFVDSIDAAERSIYIENQFFTSNALANRLAQRMRERPDLEVLLVGPQTYDSWIEAKTMRNGRIRFMRTLAEGGVADRVRLLYPHINNTTSSTNTMVHSKVMIVDDRFLRVGTANLNNRSMGTDTECDLAIEARTEAERAAIASVASRLLADHCGTSPTEVLHLLASGRRLIDVAQALSGAGHSLRLIDDGEPEAHEFARYLERVADPERPIEPDALTTLEFSGRSFRLPFANLAKLGLGLLFILALTAVWKLTPIAEQLTPGAIQAAMDSIATSPWAPVYVLAAFLGGGLIGFPVTLLIAGTSAAFGPVFGFIYAALGSLASAVLTYLMGAWLGQTLLQSVLGPRLSRIRNKISRSGIVAMAAIRLVPVAPFTLVNMVAGACRIPVLDYVIGTALGLLPGLLAMSALGYQVFRIIIDPSPVDFVLLAGAILIWLGIVFATQTLAGRLRSSTS
jgi:phospholipase D1/2